MTLEENWIDRTREATLDPELPICDPHHHLWNLPKVVHPPERRYLLDDLLADTGSGHNVVSTVYIECRAMYRADGPKELRPIGETEFANGAAAMSASGRYGPTRVAAGIVGHADLTLGDAVEPVLEAQLAAGGGRFRGIRYSVSWDASDQVRNAFTNPPEGLYGDAQFRRGFAQLAPLGLSFEGWLYHPQIGELTDLARAFPDTTIVLDHFGGPLGIGPYAGRRAEILAQWRNDLADLALCPNVVAKLGGINMAINGFGWHERDRPPTSQLLCEVTAPYYDHCIKHFGVARSTLYGWRPHMYLDGALSDDFYQRERPEPVPPHAKLLPPCIEERRFADVRVTGFRMRDAA